MEHCILRFDDVVIGVLHLTNSVLACKINLPGQSGSQTEGSDAYGTLKENPYANPNLCSR